MEKSIPFQNIPIVEAGADEALAYAREGVEAPRLPFGRVLKLQAAKERARTWRARSLQPGGNVPRLGRPQEFGVGTPERKLAEFFLWWQEQQFDEMAAAVAMFRLTGLADPGGILRRSFSPVHLVGFEFSAVTDLYESRTDIRTRLKLDVGGKRAYRERICRMIFADSRGLPAVVNPGEWLVFDHRFVGLPMPAAIVAPAHAG